MGVSVFRRHLGLKRLVWVRCGCSPRLTSGVWLRIIIRGVDVLSREARTRNVQWGLLAAMEEMPRVIAAVCDDTHNDGGELTEGRAVPSVGGMDARSWGRRDSAIRRKSSCVRFGSLRRDRPRLAAARGAGDVASIHRVARWQRNGEKLQICCDDVVRVTAFLTCIFILKKVF